MTFCATLRNLFERARRGLETVSELQALRGMVADRAGTVAILFGLTMISLMGFIGGAVDYANAYALRSKLQSALDSAALATGRQMDLGAGELGAEQAGYDVLTANLGEGFPSYNASIEIGDSIVTATGNMTVDTYLLGVIGIHAMNVAATSEVSIAGGTYEVALVLDNSGSMSGSKITNLKNASETLVNILFSNELSSEHVTISVVPFTASVNVGSANASASWMDQDGVSSIHAEHFDTAVTRWAMFSALSNVNWAGCVEVRPTPHDVDDTTPGPGDPNSYFVPLFAPDEPDNDNDYVNSYIDDDDGSCAPSVSGGSGYTRQRRTCKYYGEFADTSLKNGTRRGPNHFCDAQQLLPLSNDQSSIIAAINAMNAYGGTNIHEGVMWGWRTLSPSEPFAEGKPYDEEDNAKIIILMSDGQNWHGSKNTHNESWFSAYGYHAQGRLGSPSGSTSALRATMNTRTLQSCANAKNAGIIIYSVALEINDEDTIEMLQTCASSLSRFFDLNSSNSLEAAFEAIANEITKLRISG